MLQPVYDFIDMDIDHFLANDVAMGWETNFIAEVDFLYGVSGELEALYPTLHRWIKDDTIAAWHKANDHFDGSKRQFAERTTIQLNGVDFYVPDMCMDLETKNAIIQSWKLLIRDIHDILHKLKNTDDTKKIFPCCFISDKPSKYLMQHMKKSLCYGPTNNAMSKRPVPVMNKDEIFQYYIINMEKPHFPHNIHYAYGIGEQRHFEILHRSLLKIQMNELTEIMANIFN